MKRRSGNSSKKAFTLIEVLVATFILIVMVLILSKVFHQATVAWSAGFRRADGNMTGRSAVGFMARELMNACGDEEIFRNHYFKDGGHTVSFIMLAGEPDKHGRVARQITYAGDGETVTRTEMGSDPNVYGKWTEKIRSGPLAENVKKISFSCPSAAPYQNGKMPEWVGIKLTIKRIDDVSGVGAASAGPDGAFGNDDDIKSW